MYTYDAFEQSGVFVLFRPVFITILAAMVIIFITILVPKLRTMYNNVLPIVLASIIGTVLAAQLIFYDTILVDELGLGGDYVTTFLFMFTVFFAILNPCLYLWRKPFKLII